MTEKLERVNLGTVHFLRGGGAGGIWGVTKKKTALNGGPSKKKIREKGGGHVKYFSSDLRWDTFYYS